MAHAPPTATGSPRVGTDGTLAGRVRASLAQSTDVDLQDIVELVARVTETPVVALGILDSGVYHYDVCAGVAPFANEGVRALCQLASGRPGLVEVPDTLADPRTRDLPSVDGRDSAVRYYLSVPVVVDRREVGRFCVFDLRPRRLDARQRDMVRVLGDAASKILDRRLMQPAASPRRAVAPPVPTADHDGDLVARAAHDLRSPLVTLAASLELLGDVLEPEPDSMPAMLVGKAQGAVERMHDLVGGILALRSLDREPEPALVDLEDLVQSVREDLGSQLLLTGGTIHGEGLGLLLGDRSQLHSLLLNLVGNALKFTRTGVPPRVTVSSEDVPGGLLLTVADEGVGIPPEHRDEVFDLFTTLGRGGGHGIGLSTVARIVEAHGGHVSVVECPVGAAVQVFLPQA